MIHKAIKPTKALYTQWTELRRQIGHKFDVDEMHDVKILLQISDLLEAFELEHFATIIPIRPEVELAGRISEYFGDDWETFSWTWDNSYNVLAATDFLLDGKEFAQFDSSDIEDELYGFMRHELDSRTLFAQNITEVKREG